MYPWAVALVALINRHPNATVAIIGPPLKAHSLREIGGSKAIDRISNFDIERWRSARGRKVSRTTVNRELNVVRGCFSKAVEWGKLAESPTKTVLNYRVDDTKIRTLSGEEIATVLSNAPEDLALICRITLECLPRLSEVLHIHRTDIGPDWIQIRRKGGRVERVAISSELRSLIMNRLGTRTGYVFGDPPPTQEAASLAFTRLFRQLGLKGVSHHTIRHTGVTLMLEAGINPCVIQRLAGWTSLRMLERYEHVRDSEVRRAVDTTAVTLQSVKRGSTNPKTRPMNPP